MKTVYLVTRGEYSDYRIHSAWSTKKQAEAVIKILNCGKTYGDAGVEVWKVDVPPKERAGWLVTVDLTTGDSVGDPQPCVLRPDYTYDRKQTNLFMNLPDHVPCKRDGRWFRTAMDTVPALIYVRNESPDIAYKIARDYRAEILAQLEGVS